MQANPQERFLDASIKEDIPTSIRPRKLVDFVGQQSIKDNLSIFIEAAKNRSEAMDHLLLYGPPGLGKTTLAHIVANELETNFKATSAPMLTKQGDLAAILTSLEPKDVLFIDEIHRLSTAIEEVLYSAMEDFKLDIMIGEGPSAKSVRIDLPPFTLIGATTRMGLLSAPLRDRFGIDLRLNFYEPVELSKIITRSASILNISIDENASLNLAKSSRGTPRIANRLLKRARDFANAKGINNISEDIVKITLSQLNIDEIGLDNIDKEYLYSIVKNYAGGPVGIENLAAILSESSDTIEDVIEPYLMQKGFIQRTPRGRIITDAGYKHLGLEK